MQKQLIFFLLALFTFYQLAAQDTLGKLRVGYAGSEPFVMHTEKEEGIVIDIWKEIAYGLNERFQLISYPTVEDGIEAIEKHQLDVLIGPITINPSRAERANFSQPYYNTELAILAPVVEMTFWDRVKPFFSSTFLYAVLGLLVILSIVGFLFWLVEGRKSEEDYGKGVIRGIGSGVWLAVVTMTTVGYGDYAPKTAGGRFIMGAWMVISLILATSFVAGIATTFSKSSNDDMTITSLAHLDNKKVAVPNYKKIMDKIRENGGTPVAVDDVEVGYELLLKDEVDALVYDEIPLEYVLKDEHRKDYVLSKKRIEPQYYGFLFPLGSNLKRKVDLQIIRLQDTKEIIHIVDDWVTRD